MAVKMSGFQVLLLNKNVLFLNGRISDPHCTSHVFNTGLNGFYLVKFDNVWMPEKFQVLDFSSDLAHHIQALDFLTVQDFYCNLVLGDLVKSDWKKNIEMEFEFQSELKQQLVKSLNSLVFG